MEMILKRKDFEKKLQKLNSEIKFRDALCSSLLFRRYCSDLGLLLITSKLTGVAKK